MTREGIYGADFEACCLEGAVVRAEAAGYVVLDFTEAEAGEDCYGILIVESHAPREGARPS